MVCASEVLFPLPSGRVRSMAELTLEVSRKKTKSRKTTSVIDDKLNWAFGLWRGLIFISKLF
jgi:hypothetical protein